jgi:hypothetical protein
VTLVLSADHADETGGLMTTRVHAVLTNASPEDLGNAVFEALDANRFGITPPISEREENRQQMLRATGSSSFGEYERKARSVGVSRSGIDVRLDAMDRSPTGGFVGRAIETLRAPDALELGEEIHKLLTDLERG